jgi:Tfp pilus assembly protein PilF
MIWTFRILLVCLAVALGVAPAVADPTKETQMSGQQVTESDHNGIIIKATALVQHGKLDEAEQLLLGTLRLTPNPELVYFQLGCIYEQQGDSLKAIAAFKEGIKIHEQGRRKSP